MPNPWFQHVQKFREKNPSLSPQQMLKQARKTYKKKSSKGGDPTSYQGSGLASTAAKFGGNPVSYQGSGLASTAAKFGGRKSRKIRKLRRKSLKKMI